MTYNRNKAREISGFHSGVVEIFTPLCCCSV